MGRERQATITSVVGRADRGFGKKGIEIPAQVYPELDEGPG
jgi:hypothetical protein